MWEYNIVKDSWDLSTGASVDADRAQALAALNNLGAEGWELVAIERVGDSNATRLLYFLKRPKNK